MPRRYLGDAASKGEETSLQFPGKPFEQQGIGYDGHRGKSHRKTCKLRPKRYPEEGIQHSCSHRNPCDIIKERPEEVLPDLRQRGPTEADGADYIHQVVTNEYDIPRLLRHIRAAADGDTDI